MGAEERQGAGCRKHASTVSYNYGITTGRNRATMARSKYTTKATALDRHAQQFLQLKQEFKRLDYFCKGTVLRRFRWLENLP